MPFQPKPREIDRSPLTHDFDSVDLPAVEAIELHLDSTGKVWFNVNNKCLFRAGVVNRVEIIDNRPKPKRKRS